ncbi:MAG: DNA-directed RNA polymerase subunit beta, partial [Bacilli bacterium]|nr:DNA-directed RNA polymerase subunit beta [Bacilli bacterium]
SQLVRSPGAYFKKSRDKSGKNIFEGEVIPSRGTWLEYETDAKDIIFVRVDKTRKIPATILLKAIGIDTTEEIISLFGDNQYVLNTLEKDKTLSSRDAMIEIYNKVRPGEPATEEGARTILYQKFFDSKRYDLTRAGRFKFKKKLGIYNRLLNHYIAEPLCDVNGEVLYPKGTLITKSMINDMMSKGVFEKGAHAYNLGEKIILDDSNTVQMIKVYKDDSMKETINVIGTDLRIDKKYITIPDMVASFSYFINIIEGIGDTDDIDHLGNRRVRTIGELLYNQFRIGLSRMERSVKERMSISETSNITAQGLTNIRPLTAAIKEFFSSSQLSQFMDQTNPLAELTNKRRLSALGPGGLSRDRAAMEVRDVHYSHYGRICPIETPEGPNIGLINNMASYAKINEFGFLETPYRSVNKKNFVVSEDKVSYLSADEENEYVVAQANINLGKNHEIVDDFVVARYRGENIMARKEDVDYVDVSPKQIVSVATACIPFLENDDAQRALMGANMQRQAIPLLQPHSPYVGTGMEKLIAKDAGSAVVSKEVGYVVYVDSRKIIIEDEDGRSHDYKLQKFARSNQGTCINHHPIVVAGQKVEKGQIIADGPGMQNGELALGQNVTIAFMTWNGYNYEDAIIMSERMVKEDVYTSIHIEKYDIDCRETKLGPEEITRDIPNVSEEAKANLDIHGIVVPGTEVKEQDILVGKVTPKGVGEPSPEERLLMAIFGDKTKERKDNSLRVPHGGAGIVLDVKIFSRDKGDELPPGVNEVVRVYIAQKRKISEGDKMAGRHGNKGVISRILPVEDMPYLPDGTPVDIMLNPLGVPSRMNLGQVLEVHLGMAAKRLGMKVATPVFDGVSNEELFKLMDQSGMDPDGKTVLYDGRTGEQFEERISVGVMYMIKLSHMVDDKLHARATGPYSLVTQQPLGGKAQNGGQRFGEMEVWALEAYGAAHTLQEILTVKSDDMVGRARTYEAIIKDLPIPQPGMPESFRVLQKELQALAIDVKLLAEDGEELDMKEVAKANELEERKISESIREINSDNRIDTGNFANDEE